MARGIALGALGALAALLAFVCAAIVSGRFPANADAPVPWLERRIATTALRAAIRRQMSASANPLAATDENLMRGIRLYAANCAVCHGAADGKASRVAQGLYQRPPQFAVHGVEDDPEAKIHWFVQRGVRWTGMPSYRGSLNDDDLWRLTLFLKRMDSLPPGADAQWKALPSASAL